ncbi:unnamed protein product [Microthlaspi erraticum]|uniref:PGG domain-containing protein n=1 Tax=Microthlaspi erraticum TaxID=1685480 RepID=A0A6D2JYT2_9BRAS|nr:unnamed protein product [Microthlaspi erraticum]
MTMFVIEQRPRCFPLALIIDSIIPPHTESVPEFLTNLILSDLYNFPGEYVPMNPETYSAMRAGNIDFWDKMRSYGTPLACLKNDKGDSILHLAAAFGHLDLVKSIISECPSLLLESNWKDQIPLHAAAHAGRLAVVKTLVASITYFSLEEERERLNVYVLKDIDGNTPLHTALKGGHLETALCLVNANQLASFLQNNARISPLYMAVEAGGLALVKAMLNGLGRNVQGQVSNLASKLEGKKSLVHAALKAKNTDIINVILNEDPSLGNEKDEEERTCLSFGAYVGYRKGVCNLLDRSTSGVFECSDDVSFPIHTAVEKGHVDVVKEILKRCPDSIELLNKKGQNILHVAAKSGKCRSLLKHMKRLDGEKSHLIEEQDEDGNTPLHLATINWRPRMVRELTKFSSNATGILKIQNKDGLRALDIAELNLQSNYIFKERMTLMVLLSTYKPKGFGRIPTSGMTLRSRSEIIDTNNYKDRVNALLVVATLIATVTFAAGITVPGGFNNSGMAILAKNSVTFVCFVVLDILAMLSSVIAIVALIWAQMGDPELIHKAFRLALPSLSLALSSMSFAFLNGVLVTTSPKSFLSFFIKIIQIPLAILLFYLLAPYVGPEIDCPLARSANICLRILLRFVDEDNAETYHNSGSGQTRGV